MRLIFVRHPQTEANTQKLIYGRLDAGYSEKGRATIPDIADSLKSMAVDAIFSSPLSRARILAEHIAAVHGISAAEIRLDRRISEMDFGVLEGLTTAEAKTQQGEIYQALMNDYEQYRIPEGESCMMVRERVKQFLVDLYEEFERGAEEGDVAPWGEPEKDMDPESVPVNSAAKREKTVIVVSHSMAIHMGLSWLLHQEPHEIWHIKLEPGAIVDVDWRFEFAMLQGISGPLQIR